MDIMLALALSALFVAVIAQAYLVAGNIFERARDRRVLIDNYQSGLGVVNQNSYGNDLIENNITLDYLVFTAIRRPVLPNLIVSTGTPLCSADFRNNKIIGSFEGLFPAIQQPLIRRIILPINPSLPLTDLEVRNGIAYISTDSATASDPDIIIADIRHPDSPSILSTLNTGPGLVSLSIVGKRIFAAAASTLAQLHIIRLDRLESPILERTYRLPLPYATATLPWGSSIFSRFDRVYLGTEKWDGQEFSIIDIQNPLAPIKIAGMEIGSRVGDISVNNSLAYIASAHFPQLRVIDIADPFRPFLLSLLTPSGWERQEGKVLSMFEGALGFGRTVGGFNIAKDHELFSWPALSSASLDAPFSLDIPGGIYGLVMDKNHTYVATRQAGRELMIFNRSLVSTSSEIYSLPAFPRTLTCDGDHLYILDAAMPKIYEIFFP